LNNYPAPKASSSLPHGDVLLWNHYLMVVARIQL
jgi:hypothetical protein